MSVWTRIFALLLAIIAFFAAGLAALKYWEVRSFDEVAETSAAKRQAAFEDFLQRRGESLEMLALDYTYWDAMVNAIRERDVPWAERTFTDDVLAGYKANAVWIYDAALEPVHTHNNLYTDQLPLAPIPPEALRALFAEKNLSHFFAQTPVGLMEIHAASVHSSRDAARANPPAGYLLAGRLWSDAHVGEMEALSGNSISLVAENEPAGEERTASRSGAAAFTRALPGWDGAPVAILLVTSESQVFTGLSTWSRRLYIWLILTAVALAALLSISLTRWVSRPLHQISESLRREDPSVLAKLENERTEFGAMARLISQFFAQRNDLMREVEAHRQAQEALRTSEEQLRHAQKLEAVGRLAGGVAHDFNNLLTAILGYADILERRLESDPESRQNAQTIKQAGEKAAALTRQLLAFSRKQVLQPRVIDLCSLVRDMEKLFRRLIGEQIDLRVGCQPGLRVLADPGQLEQVLINLAVNARDAMPRGGKLTITCTVAALDEDGARAAELLTGHYIALEVRDTGDGMSEETRSRVFEPFFTTKKPGEGTGLGLATVYGIVKQTGGGITLQTAPGEGAVFTIYLPRTLREVDPVEPSEPPPAQRSASGTVMVAEDEHIVRELMCAALRNEGYDILCAEDGTDALQKAEAHRGSIDLVVTDVVMPGMDGGELARRLHVLRPETLILFVSGYSSRFVAEGIGPLPDAELLEKPFTAQTLVCKVRTMLEEKS